jgi:hypothetical protein
VTAPSAFILFVNLRRACGVKRTSPTAIPVYTVIAPWRR